MNSVPLKEVEKEAGREHERAWLGTEAAAAGTLRKQTGGDWGDEQLRNPAFKPSENQGGTALPKAGS